MTSPWGKVAVVAPVPCSLEDVMSEQLASDLDKKLDTETWEQIPVDDSLSAEAAAPADAGLSDLELALKLSAEEAGVDQNDEILAKFLQRQFDEEHDAMVDHRQKTFNGTSKVSVSFQNYKMKTRRESEGDELFPGEDDEPYEVEYPEVETPTKWESEKTVIGPRGYSGSGKNIVTKHDSKLCNRKNAERLMDLPSGMHVGDGEAMDMKLPNNIFNKLKSYSVSESKRAHRVKENKDHSTAIKAVDENTRILLYKLLNSGYLEAIAGEVSQGKEAVVLKASGGMTKEEQPVPKDVILKVYKTTMMDFHTRSKYIYGDHILSKDKLKKQNVRKITKIWAEKEFLNLKRLNRANIPAPYPLTLKKNVLVMTCVGGDVPAPKLKETRLSTVDAQMAYEQVVDIMTTMYQKCGLVHADLSEYNLLWHKAQSKVYVIDVSQSVEIENVNSYEFLLRDCQNICKYFSQQGVHGVATAEDLFMAITHFSFEGKGKVFTSQVQRYDKENYSFDYFFDKEEEKREQALLDTNDSDSDSESEEEEEEEEAEAEAKKEAEKDRLGGGTLGEDKQTKPASEKGEGRTLEGSDSSSHKAGGCVAGSGSMSHSLHTSPKACPTQQQSPSPSERWVVSNDDI